MTCKRYREVQALIDKAGLERTEPISNSNGNHLKTVVRNVHGLTITFQFALTPGDRKTDLVALTRLRRFARQTELKPRGNRA